MKRCKDPAQITIATEAAAYVPEARPAPAGREPALPTPRRVRASTSATVPCATPRVSAARRYPADRRCLGGRASTRVWRPVPPRHRRLHGRGRRHAAQGRLRESRRRRSAPRRRLYCGAEPMRKMPMIADRDCKPVIPAGAFSRPRRRRGAGVFGAARAAAADDAALAEGGKSPRTATAATAFPAIWPRVPRWPATMGRP
jgi:hypothetical protein